MSGGGRALRGPRPGRADPMRADTFRKLAEVSGVHTEVWARKLKQGGLELPPERNVASCAHAHLAGAAPRTPPSCRSSWRRRRATPTSTRSRAGCSASRGGGARAPGGAWRLARQWILRAHEPSCETRADGTAASRGGLRAAVFGVKRTASCRTSRSCSAWRARRDRHTLLLPASRGSSRGLLDGRR